MLAKKEGREKVKREGITRSKFLQYLGYLSGGLVLGTMFTGMFKWVYDFKIYDHKIKFPNLPSDFEGLRIIQISDLHLGSWNLKEPLEQAVEMINDMDPDLVLFTGDLVNFSTQEAYRFAEDVYMWPENRFYEIYRVSPRTIRAWNIRIMSLF